MGSSYEFVDTVMDRALHAASLRTHHLPGYTQLILMYTGLAPEMAGGRDRVRLASR